MRVLQCINSLATGGAEKLVVDSVSLYNKKGLHVDVLLLNNSQSPFLKILKEKSKVSIIGLSKGSVYNPILIFKIIPYLKRYDIVHAHLFPMLYWLVLAKWLSFSKVKIVYTEHSTHNKRRDIPLLKFVDRFIYQGVSQIVSISQVVQERLISHLKFKNNSIFTIIHNGINIDSYQKSVPYQKSDFYNDSDFILIQVSSFRYPKDQPTLIKSLQFLPNNIKLLLVGEGPLKEDCQQLVTQLNLNNRINFLGIRSDVARLLKTVDVVVLSSQYEGLSLSSIEGMVNKPFIASNVKGLKEVVEGYGLLFTSKNEIDLGEKVLSLYNDRDFYNQIQKRCQQRSLEFDIHKMVDSYISVYKKLENEN